MSIYVKNWNELRQITNESETHILSVDEYSAWLKAKTEEPVGNEHKDWCDRLPNLDVYLSTHTFYSSNYKHYTKVLQLCGFDVELANWDEPNK